MPQALPADVRAGIAKRTPAPIYLILGDDDAEMSRLAADVMSLVEDELRAFNVDRLYAGEKTASPAAIVEAARQLPMMGDRRVVVVLRAELILKPKRRGGKSAESADDDDEGSEASSDTDALTDYLQAPVPSTTLVLVSSGCRQDAPPREDAPQARHRRRVLGTEEREEPALHRLRAAARKAEEMVRRIVAESGQQIEPAAARLVAERAGVDIVRLRGDVERLVLYAAGQGEDRARRCAGGRQRRDGAGRLGRHQRDRAAQDRRGAAAVVDGDGRRRRALHGARSARVVRP